jgi:hypothetical protein
MVGNDGGIVGVGVVEGDGRRTGLGGGADDGDNESRSIVGVGVVDVGV